MSVDLIDPRYGKIGTGHKLQLKKDEVLVIQLPRLTEQISENYLEIAINSIQKILPEHTRVMYIGGDINLYGLAGEAAVELKLKGIF